MSRGPLVRILDLFSSVRLGIVTLTLLFIYSTLGSAGLIYPVSWRLGAASSWRHEMVRQWPAFEMTEFEWFHTPAFLALCALLTINIAVTTLRRIPFRVVNLGVWMIHTGIIILVVGSVIYFGTKVEGDTPVIRREVVARIGADEVRLPAVPGARATLGAGETERSIRIGSIEPDWPILSGDDAGTRVYSVNVVVDAPPAPQSSRPATYVRQLLDGYPQYTEDVIPGRGRALKLEEFAARTVDNDLTLTLEPSPQPWYWIKDSNAIALRELSDAPSPWSHRKLRGVPRYNDWIPAPDAIWPSAEIDPRAVRPLSAEALPGDAPDALGDVGVRVIGFLRYAVLEERRTPGGADPIPLVDLEARNPSGQTMTERITLTGGRRGAPVFGGMVQVRPDGWLGAPAVNAADFASGIDVTIAGAEPMTIAPDDPLARAEAGLDIGGSGWRIRVDEVFRDIDVGQSEPVSLAILRITTPEGAAFTRWAFPDAAITRDIEEENTTDPHGEIHDRPVDARISTVFRPGVDAALVLAVSSSGGIRAFQPGAGGAFTERPLAVGEPVTFGGGAAISVAAFHPTSHAESRPVIVPKAQRDRDADSDRLYALALLEFHAGDWSHRVWAPFCKHAFDDPNLGQTMIGRYEPVTVALPDGRIVEAMFTRERRPLPDPVVLDDFVLTATVGGFTGDMSSIRDWTSLIRFDERGQGWSETKRVETNEPAAHAGLRFFQAYWDAPRSGSSGMSFTGLGVGNRRGVITQLVGCTIAVIGMMYAFYVKPIIKRRRRDRVLAAVASRTMQASVASPPIETGAPA